MMEAINNNWLSPYREYKVLLDVDLTEYNKVNAEFIEHFSYFNNDFNLAMSCVTDWKARNKVTAAKCNGDSSKFKEINKLTLIHALGFNRTLQARKNFIYNHPKKIELANLILEHRQNKKCITFSKNIKTAEQLKFGKVLSSKSTKKKGRITLQEFIDAPTGAIHTSKMLNQGTDIPGLSVAIILGFDSSNITAIQTRGRVIRYAENKIAEIFVFVIKGTVEEAWYQNAIGNRGIPIGEDQLLNVLEGKDYVEKKQKETQMLFRF